MIQPEPYEVIRQYTEPVITHHVSYKEAGPMIEKGKAVVSSGIGNKIVAEGVEVLPLEPWYATLPRTSSPTVTTAQTTVVG